MNKKIRSRRNFIKTSGMAGGILASYPTFTYKPASMKNSTIAENHKNESRKGFIGV